MSVTLADLKKRISDGMNRHYSTPKGQEHRRKLSETMKKRWEELKKAAEVGTKGVLGLF